MICGSKCVAIGYRDHRVKIWFRRCESRDCSPNICWIILSTAADEVSVAVGEVGVVAGDEGFEGEGAVLAEGDFAEEVVAEDVGGEEVSIVTRKFGILRRLV